MTMTELDIRELLDDYQDGGLEIREKEIISLDKVKEEVMNRIDKPTRRGSRRMIRVLAAAAVCAAALTVTALAAGVFRLGERQAESSSADYEPDGAAASSEETAYGVPDMPIVNATGYAGSPEYLAAGEWENYLRDAYAAGENEFSVSGPEEAEALAGDMYIWMDANSREARDALDSILEKYALKLPGYERDIGGQKALYDLTGKTEVLPMDAAEGEYPANGRYFEGGSLQIVNCAKLGGETEIGYDLYRFAKGWFSRSVGIYTDLDAMEEWTYTTADGTTVTLDMGANQSILMAELDNSFVYVHIRGGTENSDAGRSSYGRAAVSRESLEAFADAIDFSALDSIT